MSRTRKCDANLSSMGCGVCPVWSSNFQDIRGICGIDCRGHSRQVVMVVQKRNCWQSREKDTLTFRRIYLGHEKRMSICDD